MLTKMMEWVSKHILLAPFMLVVVAFLFGCKSQKPIVTSSEKTTVTITQRDVPVFTPLLEAKGHGKIWIDPKGLPRMKEFKVTSNSNKPPDKQPKITVNLDQEGNLNVDVVIPEDTLYVEASDTTKVTATKNTEYVEVEQENPWWKKMLMFLGVLVIFGIIYKFVKLKGIMR